MKRLSVAATVAVAGMLLAGGRPVHAWQFQFAAFQGQGGGGYARPVGGSVGLVAETGSVGLVGAGGCLGGVPGLAYQELPTSRLLYAGYGRAYAPGSLVAPGLLAAPPVESALIYPQTVPYGAAGYAGVGAAFYQAAAGQVVYSPSAPAIAVQANIATPGTVLSTQRAALLLDTMDGPAAAALVGTPGPGDLSRQVEALARQVERLAGKVKEHDARLSAPAMPRPTPE